MRYVIPIGVPPPPPIPGVRYWEDSHTLDGSPDAIIAACDAIGVTCTVKRPAPAKVQLPTHVKWREYQREGIAQIVALLREHKGAILADDMGLGKTPQGAAIAANLGKRTLVVCPAGVRHQWAKWLADVTGQECATLGPLSEKEFKLDWETWRSGEAAHATVSYALMEDAIKAHIPGTIMFDEAHSQLQGRANQNVQTLWKYGAAISYKLMLTGTPYLSKLAGMWQLLNLLHGRTWGYRAREFDVRYCNGHQGQWGWDNKGATHVSEFKKRLGFYMVRRMKADVATELPKVTRTIRWVDANAKATAALAKAQHTVAGMRGAVGATLDGKDSELVVLMKEAQTNGQPTVIFTWQRKDADRVGQLLTKKDIPNVVIHGENDAATRAKMVADAYTLRTNVVTTYGSSGQGLDGLQLWCSNAIYHAIDPVPAIILQASGRLDRIGQTNPVTETYLAMRESVDELTVDKVVSRLDVWASVMGSDKTTVEVRNTLAMGGLDVDKDAVLDAIFKEMTGEM